MTRRRLTTRGTTSSVGVVKRTALLVIGESPSPGVDSLTIEGRVALRLARMMGLESTEEMDALISTRNLLRRDAGCHYNSVRQLREEASLLVPRLIGRPTIMLGSKVATSFGLVPRPWFVWRRSKLDSGAALSYAVVPHVSAVNRSWNDRATYAAAVLFLERALADARSGVLEAEALRMSEEYARRQPADDLLSYYDVAAYFGMDVTSVRMWVMNREISHVKIGDQIRFRWIDLKAFYLDRLVPARPRHPAPELAAPEIVDGRAVNKLMRHAG